MAKSKPSPNQPTLPGIELDLQQTFDFAKLAVPRAAGKPKVSADGPAHVGRAVEVAVPDFSNPRRPKTCLEVDFPIVPINELSALEGNAGKPIYQMSKWWARRRSSVFRAMLIAAAMQAPIRTNPDGTPVLDSDGIPVPDETEAAKAVWDVYYANHQKADNFRHLRVLDCFMGGGTTLVDFKGETAREDRKRLVLHRLFQNRGNVTAAEIEQIVAAYAQERTRLLFADRNDKDQSDLRREVVACWPANGKMQTVSTRSSNRNRNEISRNN